MPGKMVHFELPSEDVTRAKSFWSGLFGWSFNDPGVAGMEYWITQTGDDQGGGIYASDGSRRGPIVYFDTDDIDDSLAKVTELGGKAGEKGPIPHIGWFAHCADSEGNEFSLFQSDESAGV